MKQTHTGPRPIGGGVLSQWMDAHGQSHEQVAERLGIDAEQVRALCRGARKPSIPLAYRIEEMSGGEVTVGCWFETPSPKRT